MLMCREELLKTAQEHGVAVFEYTEVSNKDILLNLTVSDFLECFLHRCPELFYRYTFLPDSEVIINGDTLCEVDSEVRKQLERICPHLEDLDWYVNDFIDGKAYTEECDLADYANSFTDFEKKLCADIAAYDKTVDHHLSDRPIKLDLFVIYQGKLVGVCEEDDWSAEIVPASQALKEIMDSKQKEIISAEKELREIRKNAEKRLREYLLHCQDFKSRTNKGLRQRFARDLWDDSEFDWIHKVFEGPVGPTQDYFDQFDLAYDMLKSMKT